MNSDLIKEYYDLKKELNLQSTGYVKKADKRKLISFVEKKLLKIDSVEEVDTIELSKRINKFLNENGVSERIFRRNVFGLGYTDFFSEPKKWSSYSAAVQKRIRAVESFLNNRQKQKEFVERFGRDAQENVDTLSLSKRVNKLLGENLISIRTFNSKIIKMAYPTLVNFLRTTKRFSRYKPSVQNEIRKINKFMNDERRVKGFVEKENAVDTDSDFRVEFIKDDDNDSVILLSD